MGSNTKDSQTEPHHQIPANPLPTTTLDIPLPRDPTQPSQLTAELPERANVPQHISSQDPKVPESAVLVVCLPDEPHETSPDCLPVNAQAPVPKLLGNLIERGVAKKLYLTITLENEVRLEALVDTGADLTLMSSQLFDRLQTEAKRQNRTLKCQRCVLNVQSYSQNEVQLEQVAPIHLTIGPMSVVHPVYISPMDSYPLLIGKDLLDRFEPLLDFKQLKIWAQVREPLPPQSPRSLDTDCQVTEVMGNLAASCGNAPSHDPGSRTLLCAFQLAKDLGSDNPQVRAGLQLNDVTTTDIMLALWADNSAISLTLFNALKRHTPSIPIADKRTRFSLEPCLSTLVTAKSICALNLKWNSRCLTHYFLILPDLPHDVYIGADILIRLRAHVDLINEVIWAPMTSLPPTAPVNLENLASGQTIPEACTLINEQETVVPAYTKGVAVRLNLRCGQTLSHTLGFFQPSPECTELGLTIEATPLVEVTSRTVHILFNNCMALDIRVPKAYRLGWLVSYDFQDFELVLPIIGPIPASMIPEGSSVHTVSTVPFKIITLISVMPMLKEQVCRTELTGDKHLAVYTISSHPICKADSVTSPLTVHTTEDGATGEPFPGFETQVQQILKDADAIQEDADRHKLRQVLYKYKDSFAKDSLDCGLTDLHVVRIPTPPNAPPSFVKQYKIPLESYEPVQEIISSMLEKGIIRPCNSTYSAPIWPVLKPNGKWRPTIDYRKLNQQVPLSRWPMTQLEQEIPRIRGATIFSTLDVALGFWTIPVHPDDQHKLAFTFGNRQYTYRRCPFGYANAPAEFNIFLNKACPDARVRGNLIFVDDFLLKHKTVAEHLKEIDHVLQQLTTAGAKIALHKGQWCKSKVNYVGLLVGPQGIEPQTSRIQAIQNIKPPATVSELRSFLGVCNYSRQFIENYSDIARPLTALLKKDCPFIWTDTQQNAMNELKRHLCTAPCLAHPDPQKEFYLDAGFSNHCLSAGLFQRHDQDRRVVAYASKTLLPPECKYSDCEKALLCTIWAIQRFSNYIGAQKVIIETCHQPVTFLNSQRIRDGVVTNARIATWLMTLQGRNVEARYAQNHKSALGNGLAACQSCSDDLPMMVAEAEDPSPQPLTCHRYFEEGVCQGMPTAYVDGCSYNHNGILKAGAGVLWLNDQPCPPQRFKLGAQSSQYAEIAAILITLQMASNHNIRDLLICTDSNYARLSFTCHLPNWKQNGFKTANNKSVKHQHLFQACDNITTKHDMTIYWKKVKGHSKQPGTDKDLNDQTDALAKTGALHGELWSPPDHPPTLNVTAITRTKRTQPITPPASQTLALAPQITDIPTSKSKPQSPAATQRSHIPMVRPANRLGWPPPQVNEGQQVLPHSCVPVHQVWTTPESQLRQRYPLHSRDHAADLENLGIHAQLHISQHPISSGQVERSNQSVVNMLRKYVSANQKDWDVKLPLVLMAIRATPQESTGVSPFELMTGRQMTLPLHLLYQPGDSNLVTAYTTHQYLNELHQHLRTTFAFAQQRLQKSAEGQKAYYDRKASHQELEVGDKIWYYRYAPPPQTTSNRISKKFLPRWTGPHEIVDKLSPVAYRIKLSRGQKESVLKWVHRNQIKKHVAAGRERQGGASTN
ncbi:hypothetical protein QQF64_029920 [Cirrhinus molitorella]|uniref:ribonuclease H n=1 Tax=Cirrhinus molitorella TaxID=172907 RepID=A0ABR3N201_9TELE